jgi:hypothetical protein
MAPEYHFCLNRSDSAVLGVILLQHTDQFNPIAYLQLFKHIIDVMLYRILGDIEFVSDFRIVETLENIFHDFDLSRRQVALACDICQQRRLL